MRRPRRTLPPMDLDYPAQLRLAREVRDVIIDHGGSWPAVESALVRQYPEDLLEDALMVAVGQMFTYRAPGGPKFFVEWREREPVESEPARPPPHARWDDRHRLARRGACALRESAASWGVLPISPFWWLTIYHTGW